MLPYPYNYVLYSICLMLIVFGINYAYQIKHTPVRHGKTYTSVVTGTIVIAIGSAFILYVVFDYYNLIETLWPWVFTGFGVLVGVGFWMAAFQFFKGRDEKKRGDDINDKNFDQ